MVTGLAVGIVFVKAKEQREGLEPRVPIWGQARPHGLRSALLRGLPRPGRACSGASGDQGGGLDSCRAKEGQSSQHRGGGGMSFSLLKDPHLRHQDSGDVPGHLLTRRSHAWYGSLLPHPFLQGL